MIPGLGFGGDGVGPEPLPGLPELAAPEALPLLPALPATQPLSLLEGLPDVAAPGLPGLPPPETLAGMPETVTTPVELSAAETLGLPPESDVTGAASQVQTALEGRKLARQRLASQAAAAAAETDEERRRAALEELANLQGESAIQDAAVADARAGLDEERAVAEAETGARVAQAQLEAQEQAARQIADASETAALRRQVVEEERRKLESQLAQDRASYRELLQRGPKQKPGWGMGLAMVLTEALRANRTRTEPNFAGVMEAFRRSAASEFQEEQGRRLAAIELTGDALRDSAAQLDAIRTGEGLQQTAILEEIQRDLDLRIQRARTPAEREQMVIARDAVVREREAAEQRARLEANERAQREAAARADLLLKQAQIEKTMSEAEKARIEAARKRGIGANVRRDPRLVDRQLAGLPAKTAEGVRESGVRLHGQILTNPDGSFVLATSKQVLERLQPKMAAAEAAVDLANQLLALRAKHGVEWLPGALASDARQTMESLAKDLQLQLKDAGELGALDKGSADFLNAMTGNIVGIADPTPRLKAIASSIETKTRAQLGATSNYRGRGDLFYHWQPPAPADAKKAADKAVRFNAPQNAFNVQTGTVLRSEERLGLLDDANELAQMTEGGRVKAQPGVISRLEVVTTFHDATVRAIDSELAAAEKAKNPRRVATLTKARAEEERFGDGVRARLAEAKRLQGQQERRAEQRAAARKQAETLQQARY